MTAPLTQWTIQHEKKVEVKGSEIIASIHLNRMSQRYFDYFDLMFTLIISTGIFCIGFFKEQQFMENGIVYTSFSIGILKLFQTFFNFKGKAAVYETTRKSYEDIVDFITEELAENRQHRKMEPDAFIKQITKDVNSVNKNAPVIYDFVVTRFYQKYQYLKTAKPLTANQIEIVINNSDNGDKIDSKRESTWKKYKNRNKANKETSPAIETATANVEYIAELSSEKPELSKIINEEKIGSSYDKTESSEEKTESSEEKSDPLDTVEEKQYKCKKNKYHTNLFAQEMSSRISTKNMDTTFQFELKRMEDNL